MINVEEVQDLLQHQKQRLYKLVEELGEVQHALGKVLVHGIDNYHPSFEAGFPKNRDLLEEEIGHVMAIVEIMDVMHDVRMNRIKEYAAIKKRKWFKQCGY